VIPVRVMLTVPYSICWHVITGEDSTTKCADACVTVSTVTVVVANAGSAHNSRISLFIYGATKVGTAANVEGIAPLAQVAAIQSALLSTFDMRTSAMRPS